VAKLARGYVYYVSLKGVTGASHLDTARWAGSSPRFGATCGFRSVWASAFRDAASARAIAADADAVVIGSRIIQEIESGPADGPRDAPARGSPGFAARSTRCASARVKR
jgi:tryptophan synthase alpha chain